MKCLNRVSCVLLAAAFALPAGAFAQGMGFRLPAQDQRSQPAPQRGAEPPMPQRDMRGMGDGDGERGHGRMSPEQRRQLRQDIQDAGKDIYRAPREGRGGEQRRSGRR
jgi:hypothetical protein